MISEVRGENARREFAPSRAQSTVCRHCQATYVRHQFGAGVFCRTPAKIVSLIRR